MGHASGTSGWATTAIVTQDLDTLSQGAGAVKKEKEMLSAFVKMTHLVRPAKTRASVAAKAQQCRHPVRRMPKQVIVVLQALPKLLNMAFSTG